MSLEELVSRAKPTVVYLKGLEISGSGFFVTETGVIATNAHVARGDPSLLVKTSDGLQLPAKVLYVDGELDIALLKVEAPSPDVHFPFASLAEAASVRQGESVVAIGNPGDAMLFSVTKGIVSAVGKFPSAGPGVWIQTDAPTNPGNSGGPLVNERGQVIGLNTQKLVKKNVTGIGFALSASDLLDVLQRFYPQARAERVNIAARPQDVRGQSENTEMVSSPTPVESAATRTGEGTGAVTLTSVPDGAEIFVDDKFVGNAPAVLKLPAGTHRVVLKFAGFADYARELELTSGSKTSLRATLEPTSP